MFGRQLCKKPYQAWNMRPEALLPYSSPSSPTLVCPAHHHLSDLPQLLSKWDVFLQNRHRPARVILKLYNCQQSRQTVIQNLYAGLEYTSYHLEATQTWSEWMFHYRSWITSPTHCRPSIVAIHGLDGNSEESWTAPNGKMWLRDFLPSIIPQARIITYGYDADTRGPKPLSRDTIYNIAQTMLAHLSSAREDTNVSLIAKYSVLTLLLRLHSQRQRDDPLSSLCTVLGAWC